MRSRPAPPVVPAYRLHRATGQGRVTIRGRDYYLGRHGSPESLEKYRRLLVECATNDGAPKPRQTAVVVRDVTAA